MAIANATSNGKYLLSDDFIVGLLYIDKQIVAMGLQCYGILSKYLIVLF